MKKTITSLLLLIGLCATAQVKVGDNPTTINSSAVLEVESTTKGLLPPRMTTAQRDAISNPTVGLMIFNTESNCTETFLGLGVTGTSTTGWKNLCKANINATFTASTLNCAVANSLKGDYVATVAMTEANYKIVTVTTLTAGDYTVSTDEQNGVKFSAEGTISSVGAGTQLKLIASGIPVAAGAFTYTVTLSGQTCTFSVTFANPPATLQNGSVTCSGGTLSGNYTEGAVTVTTVHTRTVTVTPTSIGYCTLSTNTVNGVTFSGTATFTAGQVGSPQIITLRASGTPVTFGTFNYEITGSNITSGCAFDVDYTASKSILFGTVSGTLATGQDATLTSLYNNKFSAVNGKQITLLPGKTYYLQAEVFSRLNPSGWVNFAWVDASNNALPFTSTGSIQSQNRSSNDGGMPIATAYITPTVTTVVKLRYFCDAGISGTIDVGYSKFLIKEVSNSLYYKGKTGSQTFTAVGQAVNFSQLTNNTISGNSITSSGTSISLKGGKTYKLIANLLPLFSPNASATNSYATFKWYNGSGNAIGTANVLFSQSNNTNENMQNAAIAVISPSTDTQVSLKMVSLAANNSLNLHSGFSSIIVEEIEAGQLYYFGTINSQTIATGNTDINVTQVSNNTNNSQSVTSSGAVITLKAGRRYYVSTRLFGAIAGSYMVYQLVDSSNAQISSSKRGAALGMTYDTPENSQPELSAIIQATTDIQIKLRSAFQGGSVSTVSEYSPILITEL